MVRARFVVKLRGPLYRKPLLIHSATGHPDLATQNIRGGVLYREFGKSGPKGTADTFLGDVRNRMVGQGELGMGQSVQRQAITEDKQWNENKTTADSGGVGKGRPDERHGHDHPIGGKQCPCVGEKIEHHQEPQR